MKTCTRWQAPGGMVFLELPRILSFFQTFAANAAPAPDIELGTPPDFDFVCKVVSYTGITPGTILQIQWPDGRYLSNPGVDAFSFIGTGMRGRLLTAFKKMPPSSKIRITVDNSQVAAVSAVELHFEGVLRIPLVNGAFQGASSTGVTS
jgi:hypothetical protein